MASNGAAAARLALAALLLAGAARVIHEFWVCDDAFITFRYSRNWVDGLGLVYNAGERVEGYTNFLWMVLIAAGLALGIDAVLLGNVLGLGFFLATVWLLWRTGRRMGGAGGFPVAAVGLVCHYHYVVYASCGLETAMFGFLVTALLVLLIEARTPAAFALAGIAGTLGSMTRPDGLLPYGIGGLFALVLTCRQRSLRPLLAIALPGLAAYVPYFLWKLSYYGYPFPNTFYAKSADQPYLEQGLHYVATYFQCYWVLVVPLALVVVGAVRAAGRGIDAPGWSGGRAPLLIAAFAISYLAFVAWVGGDFMFARFALPVTPALYLVLQLAARPVRGRLAGAACAAAVGAATLLMAYPDAITVRDHPSGIVEEKRFYPRDHMEQMRRIGLRLGAVTRGTDTRVVIHGGQAVLAYYAAFPLVIEGSTGLTDRYIAHLPLDRRYRIGHEKNAPLAYLLERRVDFLLGARGSAFGEPLGALRDIDFGGIEATILNYRRAVMDPLAGADGVTFTRWDRYLDDYVASIDQKPLDQVRADYGWFKQFYFAHNDDPVHERAFLDRLPQ